MKKKRKLRKRVVNFILNILIVICIGVICFCGYKLYTSHQERQESMAAQEEVKQIISLPEEPAQEWTFTKANWASLYAINPAFVGYLYFPSGIIAQPVMQSSDNADYLFRNIQGNYDVYGSVFRDYRADSASMNETIYGHYVYTDESMMFSPFSKFYDASGYEENKYFDLYLEDEVRHYEIVYVMKFDLKNFENYDFSQPEYTEEDFAKLFAFYDTLNAVVPDAKISYGDRFVTFQTCVRNVEGAREILVAKEISAENYG